MKRTRNFRQRTRQVMGIHSCLETIKVRPKKIRTLYVQDSWSDNHDLKAIVQQARRYKIHWEEQTRQQLNSFGQGHQGVALTVEESPEWKKSSTSPITLIYIDGIEDPRNLGAIIRTSWLMGVDALFLPTRRSIQALTSAVCKTASGGVEHVPVEFISHPLMWLQRMKKKDFWIYGLDPKAEKTLDSQSFAEKRIFVVGSEGKGVSLSIKKQCDHWVSIPQNNKDASYNLSVAVALGLYQARLPVKKDNKL